MKFLTIIPFFFIMQFFADNSYARSLRATADKLGRDVSQIGFGLALLGLALGAIYLIIGKQDAPVKITQTLIGIVCLAASPSIVKFLRSAV